MNQTVPTAEEIAFLIDAINKKDLFSCLREEYFDFTTGVEYRNMAMLTNSYLIKLNILLRSRKNSIEKKEDVAKAIDLSKLEQEKFWNNAKKVYTIRNLYLPVEHADIKKEIIKNFIRMPNAKEQYKSINEYSEQVIKKGYNELSDAAKISAEKLYWHDLFEDSINDKGLARLEEEKVRYRSALALIPTEFSDKFPQFALNINPIVYLLSVLKAYSEDLTITVVS